MKLIKVLCSLGLVASTSALATQYNCGIWLDKNDDPTVTFQYDSTTPRSVARAGDFAGGVVKQDNGDLLIISQRVADKVSSAALYNEGTEIMLSALILTDGKSATTACQAGGQLVRPRAALSL